MYTPPRPARQGHKRNARISKPFGSESFSSRTFRSPDFLPPEAQDALELPILDRSGKDPVLGFRSPRLSMLP